MPNSPNEEILLGSAVGWLQRALPPNWDIQRSSRQGIADPSGRIQSLDTAIDLRAPNGMITTLAVEVKERFTPRDVDRLQVGLARTLQLIAGYIPVLVVAGWLSTRTMERLAAQRINYLDLTGNALIRIDNPTVYIKTAGSSRDPSPRARGEARVRGPKAGRLVRLLVDIKPPYGVSQIARVTRLAPGYVSRLLESLDREALVERKRRGEVTDVVIDALLRRWAQSYDVFRSNTSKTYLAASGAADVLTRLKQSAEPGKFAITGSFAAVRFAPIAKPSLLLVYRSDESVSAGSLALIPSDEGSNIVLLDPFDSVVWERTMTQDGVSYVAPSQAAVDCLTGNGRMPSEGEALVDWMIANESTWRLPSLEAALQA